jgi:hypothetical protein
MAALALLLLALHGVAQKLTALVIAIQNRTGARNSFEEILIKPHNNVIIVFITLWFIIILFSFCYDTGIAAFFTHLD